MIRQRFRHEGDRAAAHLRYGICSRDVDGLYGQGVLFSSFKVCFGSHLPQLPSRSRLDIAAPGFPRALLLPFSAGDNALCMRAFLRAYKVHLERAQSYTPTLGWTPWSEDMPKQPACMRFAPSGLLTEAKL